MVVTHEMRYYVNGNLEPGANATTIYAVYG